MNEKYNNLILNRMFKICNNDLILNRMFKICNNDLNIFFLSIFKFILVFSGKESKIVELFLASKDIDQNFLIDYFNNEFKIKNWGYLEGRLILELLLFSIPAKNIFKIQNKLAEILDGGKIKYSNLYILHCLFQKIHSNLSHII